jgi:hypothetical protein
MSRTIEELSVSRQEEFTWSIRPCKPKQLPYLAKSRVVTEMSDDLYLAMNINFDRQFSNVNNSVRARPVHTDEQKKDLTDFSNA